MNEPLLLHVPEQHDYRNPVVELNPKRLGRWLGELPLMNLSGCLEQVLDALAPCNLQAMPGKNRVRLLELYRDTVARLFDAMGEAQSNNLPMAASERRSSGERLGLLCTELAIGYKILVREALRSDAPGRQPLLAPALYRAMEATAWALLHGYRSYQPAPAFAYLELHRLYALAERCALQDAPITMDKQPLPGTIGALYRQVLLTAVIDPYRLPAGAVARLYPLLGAYAPHCLLQQGFDPGEHPEGCFVIDRGSDTAPVPASRGGSDYGYDDPLLLDIRPALQAIAEALASVAQERPEDARLLARLVPELQRKRERQAPRRDVQREAWVTFGLASVHHFLARGPAAVAEAIRMAAAPLQVRDLDSVNDDDHGLAPWAVVNESVSGYLLASRERWQGEARVGETVGVVVRGAKDAQPRLTVATVRWMRAARDERVEMGVEIIPGMPRAIQCSPAGGEDVAGLFFPSAPALQLPATLVLPKGIYRADALIAVRTGERVLEVRAGSLVTETECFDRFDFTSS